MTLPTKPPRKSSRKTTWPARVVRGLKYTVAGGVLLGATVSSATTATPVGDARVPQAEAAAEHYIAQHGWDILNDFKTFLSLPNVASNHADMVENAAWITGYLGVRGFVSETVTAGGAPYVIARRDVPGATRTVLIYAHFDGQPVAPENWASPPFTPTLRDGMVEDGGTVVDWQAALGGPIDPEWRLFARSAGDDKAPVIALMAALDALEGAGIAPVVNIKLILDGEEEAGSPTLAQILARHGDKLDADLMLFCDGPMHQSRQRQLVFGVRGSMTVDLTTYGPGRPLHSGHYGNWAPHPTDRLMRLLTSLKDDEGRITVPGYLDTVRPISDAERAAIAAMPDVDAHLRRELAMAKSEGGGVRLEEAIMAPAIVVKGFQAGVVGTQSRNTILPTATASLNLRLVPDQTPEDVRTALEAHFRAQGFHIVYGDPDREARLAHDKILKVDWRPGPYPAYRAALDGAEADAIAVILDQLKGGETLRTPTLGGSLPIYLFEQALDMPIVLLPIANHDNNQHGRNENLRLKNLFDAIAIYAAVIAAYGGDG